MSRKNSDLAGEDLTHVAWHEAGNGVVAYLLGVRSIEMSVWDVIFKP